MWGVGVGDGESHDEEASYFCVCRASLASTTVNYTDGQSYFDIFEGASVLLIISPLLLIKRVHTPMYYLNSHQFKVEERTWRLQKDGASFSLIRASGTIP